MIAASLLVWSISGMHLNPGAAMTVKSGTKSSSCSLVGRISAWLVNSA